jgi:hypothetical protein
METKCRIYVCAWGNCVFDVDVCICMAGVYKYIVLHV